MAINNTHLNMFKNFEEDLIKFANDHGIPYSSVDKITDFKNVEQRTVVGQIYSNVVDFLNDAQLYGNEQFTSEFSPSVTYGREKFTIGSSRLNNSSISELIPDLAELCTKCRVPDNQKTAVISNIGLILQRYNSGDPISSQYDYESSLSGSETYRSPRTIYPTGALSDTVFSKMSPGQEMFGATMDTVIPDLKMALTVALIKPNKGIMSRFMHRRTVAGSVISYIINYDEYYDLAASQDKSGSVRNSLDHRHKIIQLYRNPNPVSMLLTPVIPEVANDDADNPVLVADGILKFEKQVDLFDLSSNPLKVNFEKTNYTDLISEMVIFKGVHLAITKDSTTEKYFIDTESLPGAQFNMIQTSINNSADKAVNFKVGSQFHKDTVCTDPVSGTNTIFSAIDGTVEYVQLIISIAGDINLMSSLTQAMASVQINLKTCVKGAQVSDTLKNLASGLTVKLIGYEIDARFSEENLRKTNMAVRSMTTMITYELPQGRVAVVDYSFQQTPGEHVLNVAQEVQSIGIDHRNVQIFLKTLRSVHDRVRNERTDPQYNSNFGGHTVNTSFVSGMKVNPEVIMFSIDCTKAVSLRSSDMLSDLREYVNAYLNKIMSILHYRSLYLQNLNQNEVPTYKCLTSTLIMENLFSIPSIHPAFMANGIAGEQIYKEKNPGEPIEFTRELYSGTRLEIITTAFEYMQNKMIIVPFRSGDPNSDLNFGHNNDGGQFVANYTTVDGNAANRRVFMNTREWPTILCPVAAIGTITGLESALPDIHHVPTDPNRP